MNESMPATESDILISYSRASFISQSFFRWLMHGRVIANVCYSEYEWNLVIFVMRKFYIAIVLKKPKQNSDLNLM